MIKVQIIGYSPCSSYYVGNDQEGYLVDCPVIGDLDSFFRFTDIHLLGVILTHCHADHLTNIHESKQTRKMSGLFNFNLGTGWDHNRN